MAAIFAAAMSTISAEVNSLATVSVIDIYRRYLKRDGEDRHYLRASQLFTVFWCGYAIVTARYGAGLGSLIEAVNQIGSLFYSCMLGVFVLAFYFPRVTANGAFIGCSSERRQSSRPTSSPTLHTSGTTSSDAWL